MLIRGRVGHRLQCPDKKHVERRNISKTQVLSTAMTRVALWPTQCAIHFRPTATHELRAELSIPVNIVALRYA
jgi:hypothetical protein